MSSGVFSVTSIARGGCSECSESLRYPTDADGPRGIKVCEIMPCHATPRHATRVGAPRRTGRPHYFGQAEPSRAEAKLSRTAVCPLPGARSEMHPTDTTIVASASSRKPSLYPHGIAIRSVKLWVHDATRKNDFVKVFFLMSLDTNIKIILLDQNKYTLRKFLIENKRIKRFWLYRNQNSDYIN